MWIIEWITRWDTQWWLMVKTRWVKWDKHITRWMIGLCTENGLWWK